MKKSKIFCLLMGILLALTACGGSVGGDLPVSESTDYGVQPQATLSVFDNSFALAPEGSEFTFYKELATGDLMRMNRNSEEAERLGHGQVVGIGFEDGNLFVARLAESGAEILRCDEKGENPETIFSTERKIRQMLIVDRLIYFVAYDDTASDLWRCNLKGQSLSTVSGEDHFVGDYTLCTDTVYYGMARAEEWGDYSTYRCGISGEGNVLTGFRRGGSFFFAGEELYSAVPYGDNLLLLESLDRDAEADSPYLLEAAGSMVSALWFAENYLYFAPADSRSVSRIHLTDRQVEELVPEQEGAVFTGLSMAGGRLWVCDGDGKQYVTSPEKNWQLTPIS